MSWYRRLAGLIRNNRLANEIDAELSFHLQERVDELVAGGVPRTEAESRARRQFGNITSHKEQTRDVDVLGWVESLAQDIRYAIRAFRKNPAFTATAVLSLALGIGANTAIFTLVNTLFLNPLPVPDSSRLAAIYTLDSTKTGKATNLLEMSYKNLLDLRNENQVFSDVAGFSSPTQLSVLQGAVPEMIFAELVTGNYFDVLGVHPVSGRSFLPEEDRTPGTHPVAVLGYAAWQRRFGKDPAIVGHSVRLNGIPFTVIGIAPDGFKGVNSLFGPDLWVPAMMAEQLFPAQQRNALRDRASLVFRGAARLRPGVTLEQAQANVATIGHALAKEYPEANTGRSIALRPLTEATILPGMRESILFAGLVLMGVVGLVLLIACSNVANLLLARASARQQEIAVRQALGAGRGRLIRQLLTESVMLGILSGLVGVAFGYVARDLLWGLRPAVVANNFVLPVLDGRVFLFAFCISVLTGLVFGFAPALRGSSAEVSDSLKAEARTAGRSRRGTWLGNALVTGQVALSLVCLIVAGLFLRSIQAAYAINPGFDTRHLAVTTVGPGEAGYTDVRALQFYDNLHARLLRVPGVTSVSWSSSLPLWARLFRSILIEGAEQRDRDKTVITRVNTVDTGYFSTASIGISQGREFTGADREGAIPVAVVNETMAARYWPNASPVGRRFRFSGENVWRQVVGVSKTVKIGSLGEEPQPCAYLPLRQNPSNGMVVYIRTQGDPASVLGIVQREAQALDSRVPVGSVSTVRQLLDNSLWMEQIGVALLSIFGALALVLASVGLYGVLVYSVTRRRREIGVRMALGAGRAGVLRLILTQGMTVVGIGVLIGLCGAVALGHTLSSLLVGVSAADPLSLTAASLTLLLVALIACYLPARRASRMDPLIALREA